MWAILDVSRVREERNQNVLLKEAATIFVEMLIGFVKKQNQRTLFIHRSSTHTPIPYFGIKVL